MAACLVANLNQCGASEPNIVIVGRDEGVSVLMLSTVLVLLTSLFRVVWFWGGRSSPQLQPPVMPRSVRHVATQRPVTYKWTHAQPRFVVLPESAHGAW